MTHQMGYLGENTPMKVYYFSEFPYHEYSDEESLKYPSIRLTFPNSNFDPDTANGLFKRYFDECQYVTSWDMTASWSMSTTARRRA